MFTKYAIIKNINRFVSFKKNIFVAVLMKKFVQIIRRLAKILA